MLRVTNLSVSYLSKPVLRDFNLSVKKGEIVALVGESGSGKSTAIRAIFSLLSREGKITQGEVCLRGEPLHEKTAREWQEIRGTQMAMILQDAGAMLNPLGKIKGQFVEYLRLHDNLTKKQAYDRAVEMLAATNLSDPERVMQSYPFQLSGGMRQRVGIAMAMAFHPAILLADEPTSALDATTQKQIVEEMMALRQKHNTTIIMVTHNLGVAAYMADRILVMQNGQVVEAGTTHEIIHTPQHPYTKQLLEAVPAVEV